MLCVVLAAPAGPVVVGLPLRAADPLTKVWREADAVALKMEETPSSVETVPVGAAPDTVSEARPKPSLLQRSSKSAGGRIVH